MGYPLAQVVLARVVLRLAAQEPGTDVQDALPSFVLFATIVVTVLAVVSLANAALLVAATEAVARRDFTMAQCWRTVVRAPVLETMMLAGLATLAGLALCVLPGLYAIVALAPLLVVVCDEKRVGFAALRRCYEVMNFNPRGGLGNHPLVRVCLIVLAGAVVGQALGFVVQAPVLAIQWAALLRDGRSGQFGVPLAMTRLAWLDLPGHVLGSLAQTGVEVYASFGIVWLYFDVRRALDGAGREASLAAPPAGG
jgi:hypothetical protein